MELSKQIALFLDANGLGSFDETGVAGNIFMNTLPAQPDECLAIFTTGGPQPDPRNEYRMVNIQIVIRTLAQDPRNGETNANTLVDLLNGYNGQVLTPGGNLIIDTSAIQSGPNNIGQDQNGRFEFSQNFTFEFKK